MKSLVGNSNPVPYKFCDYKGKKLTPLTKNFKVSIVDLTVGELAKFCGLLKIYELYCPLCFHLVHMDQ